MVFLDIRADRQTDRQTYIHTYIHVHTDTLIEIFGIPGIITGYFNLFAVQVCNLPMCVGWGHRRSSDCWTSRSHIS